MHKKGFMVLGLAFCVLLGGCSGGNTKKESKETHTEAQTDRKTEKVTEKDSEMISESNTETDTEKRAETETETDSGKQAETETEKNSETPEIETEKNSERRGTETEKNSERPETETEKNSETPGTETEINSEAHTDTERETDAAGQSEAETVSEDGTEAGQEVDLSDGLFGVFETVTLDGEKVDQNIFAEADLNMVNIWGTFCGPCINEMPDLGELAEEYAEKGVRLIGIIADVREPGNEAAEKIVEATGADYTHLVMSQSLKVNYLGQVQGVPTTIFLDREGKQVGEVCVGAKSKKNWSKLIDEMLEETAK